MNGAAWLVEEGTDVQRQGGHRCSKDYAGTASPPWPPSHPLSTPSYSSSAPRTVALGQRRDVVLEDCCERLGPRPLVTLPTASSEAAIVAVKKTGAPPLPPPQRFRPVKSRGINKSEQGRRAVVKKMTQTKIETSSPGVGPGISAFVQPTAPALPTTEWPRRFGRVRPRTAGLSQTTKGGVENQNKADG